MLEEEFERKSRDPAWVFEREVRHLKEIEQEEKANKKRQKQFEKTIMDKFMDNGFSKELSEEIVEWANDKGWIATQEFIRFLPFTLKKMSPKTRVNIQYVITSFEEVKMSITRPFVDWLIDNEFSEEVSDGVAHQIILNITFENFFKVDESLLLDLKRRIHYLLPLLLRLITENPIDFKYDEGSDDFASEIIGNHIFYLISLNALIIKFRIAGYEEMLIDNFLRQLTPTDLYIIHEKNSEIRVKMQEEIQKSINKVVEYIKDFEWRADEWVQKAEERVKVAETRTKSKGGTNKNRSNFSKAKTRRASN